MVFVRLATLSALLTISAGFAHSAHAAEWTDPASKKVAILIFDGVEVIDYSGPLETFSDAGFDVFTVAASKNPVSTSAGDAVKLTPKYTFADAPQADLIVIPGGGYEAPPDSPAVRWIRRETVHAAHTMSVCNGAFTLANTGLLDGLRATTTAGNIQRLRQSYPAIKVVDDQRVVDNGKILTTAGLSAGIDGALHMVDIMKGEGAGQSVALQMEYNWQPNGSYVRGTMADRLVPHVFMNLAKYGEAVDFNVGGDNDHWETTTRFNSKASAPALFDSVKSTYANAYASDGPWQKDSFQASPAGPLSLAVKFNDRESHPWTGILAVEPAASNPRQFAIRFAIRRTG